MRRDDFVKAGRQHGRDLADRLYARMRDQGMTGDEAVAVFAEEVARGAKAMLNHANDMEDVSAWIDAAGEGYSTRIDEHIVASEALLHLPTTKPN